MKIWDISAGAQGVRYRQGRSKPAGHRKAKAGTNNRNINTSRTPLAGITPSESLEAPYLNTSSLGAWGYVYQLGSQTVAVGSNVTFTDNGPLNGIVHMPGGLLVEVTMDGVYKIEFAVYTSQTIPKIGPWLLME